MDAATYGAAFLLVLFFYFPLVIGTGHVMAGDYVDFFAPVRIYATRALHEGRIPFWAPELFGGYPFVADPQSAVFYPLNLLFAAMFSNPGSSAILDKYVLLQHVLLAMGAVFLARSAGLGRLGSVMAAVIASLNGYHIMHFAQLNMAAAEGISFFALGCLVRALRRDSFRWAVAAGIAFSCVILAGHPQSALFAFYTAAVICAGFCVRELLVHKNPHRAARAIGYCGVALLIGVAGSMIQILPTRDLLDLSQRETLTLKDAIPAEFPLKHLPGLFFPSLYQPLQWRLAPDLRWAVTHDNWGSPVAFEYLFHIGFAAFILGVFGWLVNLRRAFAQGLFWGSILLVICALGKQGVLYPLLFEYAPGFRQIRIPTRMLWLAGMAWGMLAGMAIDAIRTTHINARRSAMISAGLSAVLWLIGVAVLVVVYMYLGNRILAYQELFVANGAFLLNFHRSSPVFITDVTQQIAIASLTVCVCIAWLLAVGSKRFRRHSLLLPLLAVAGVYGELLIYGFHKNIVWDSPGFQECVDPLYKSIPTNSNGRVLSTEAGPWGKNTALVAGSELAQGYNPLLIEAVYSFLPRETVVLGDSYNETLMDLWNVRYLAFRRKELSVTVSSQTLTIPSTGWIRVAYGDPLGANAIHWPLQTDKQISAIHVISAAEFTPQLPQGKVIAEVSLSCEDSASSASYPVRLGQDTAEWSYLRTVSSKWPRHKQPTAAFSNPINELYCPQGLFFRGVFRPRQTCDVSTVTITSQMLNDTRIQNFEYHFGIPQRAFHVAADLLPDPVERGFERYLEERIPTSAPLCVSHLLLEDTSGALQVLSAPEAFGGKLIESGHPAWTVVERTAQPLGYAWLVPTAEAVSFKREYREVKERLHERSFDPQRTVLLSTREAAPSLLAGTNAPVPQAFQSSIDKMERHAEEFTVTATANHSGWLVFSHPHYKGWQAEIDGKTTKLFRANGAHCAVAFPAGKHTLRMQYRERKFLAGASVSIAVWALALIVLVWPRNRRNRENRMPLQEQSTPAAAIS